MLVMEGGEHVVDMLDVRQCSLDVATCELRYSERRGGRYRVCEDMRIAISD